MQFHCYNKDFEVKFSMQSEYNRNSGAAPATLAEFTLDGYGGQDYYGVSFFDGYNLPIQIRNCFLSLGIVKKISRKISIKFFSKKILNKIYSISI